MNSGPLITRSKNTGAAFTLSHDTCSSYGYAPHPNTRLTFAVYSPVKLGYAPHPNTGFTFAVYSPARYAYADYARALSRAANTNTM